jgi:hypothetical protein
MNKNYSFYLVLLSIPVLSFLFFGYSSGQTSQYSGSPGDSGMTCTVCHSPGANHSAVATISTDIPASGYVAGTTYSVTVSVTSSVVKHGFQITAENSSNTKVGEFSAGMGTQVANANHLVTHTSSGNMQAAWTFQWTAPTINEGPITFYAVENATNSNYADSGDQVVTTNLTINYSNLSVADAHKISFNVYPNPAMDFLTITTDLSFSNQIKINVSNSLGQIVKNASFDFDQKRIDISALTPGIYYVNITSETKRGVVKFIKK